MWPDHRLMDLFKIEHPIVLAPMAGAMDVELAVAVAQGGGLGSLPCAMLTLSACASRSRNSVRVLASRSTSTFFCHTPPVPNNAREAPGANGSSPITSSSAVDPAAPIPNSNRAPFDVAFCEVVEDIEARGRQLPFRIARGAAAAARERAPAAASISSATTVAEARWLDERGVDAVIAQGVEAGGHRGMFLAADLASQVGTFALVPQIVDAVTLPVIAARARSATPAASRRRSCSAPPACRSAAPICIARNRRFRRRTAQRFAALDRRRHRAHQRDHRAAGAWHPSTA